MSRGQSVVTTGRRVIPPDTGWEYVQCDLADAQQVDAMMHAYDISVVIHTAAQIVASGERPQEAYTRNNVVATSNLCRAASRQQGVRFINCSTISVYCGEGPYTEDCSPTVPETEYGRSKFEAETVLENHAGEALKGVSLRLGGLHGGHRTSGVVYKFVRAALDGSPLRVAEPESRFNFAFIGDVVAAIEVLVRENWPHDYAVYNLAASQSTGLGELAELVLGLTNSQVELELGSGNARNRVMNVLKIARDFSLPEATVEDNIRAVINQIVDGGI